MSKATTKPAPHGDVAPYPPNPWVFVCCDHFEEEPEDKTVGIGGTMPCAVCEKPLRQGPGAITMRSYNVIDARSPTYFTKRPTT